MEKKVIANVHGKVVNVVIRETASFLKTSHYSYGQIYISCPFSTSIVTIEKYLNRVYTEKIIQKFPNEFLYGKDFCYVLGEKRRLIRPFSYQIPEKKDLIVRNDEELQKKLEKFALDIFTSRVHFYEKEMKTYSHQVKITTMSAARGKNYIRKKLLTFHWELIHFSIYLLDAIVIHELSHDFVPNHSKKFYEILYRFCPDYDERIKKITFGVKQ